MSQVFITRLRDLARTVASLAVLLTMILPASIVLIPTASSDPVDVNNPDDTHTVTWDFDDPADYLLVNTSVSGGVGALTRYNASAVDDSAADFDQGDTRDNVLADPQGSVLLDETDDGWYQVVLQPGIEGIDSYIDENKPNDKMGDDDQLRLNPETGRSLRILISFDLSAIPGDAFVEEAVLRMYELPGGRGGDIEFGIHSLDRWFDENEVTWNRYDSTNLWTVPGGDFNSTAYSICTVNNTIGWHAFDVSKIVERWIRGDLQNEGMILVPEGAGGDDTKIFQSSDETASPEYNPTLIVNYTLQGGTGLFESRTLGPGTNATFTLASWENGTESFLTDEFDGTALDPKWTWLNDPAADGGSYDVGVSEPGWLHVHGSSNTQLLNSVITANYLNQDVTGDFVAEMSMIDMFSANSMGAGILILESPDEWVAMVKTDPGSSGKMQVIACEDGLSAQMATIAWTNTSQAFMKVERDSSDIRLYASESEGSWTPLYTHSTVHGYMQTLAIGPFIFSQSTAVPVADFDYFRVRPATDSPVEMRVRTGDSTSFTDPSWGAWSTVLPGQETVVSDTGRYLQYQAYFGTGHGWYSPRLDMFECHYELYRSAGTIETYDFVPSDFSMWLTLITSEDASRERIEYHYSTDEGTTWTYAGTGGSYSVYSAESSFRVRMVFANLDTLGTPSVDSLSVVYTSALDSFFVVTPAQVVAGEAFSVSVYAKDSTNTTMIHWTGPIALSATDADGLGEATGDLSVQLAQITSGGYTTVPNERYYVAETIRIKASSMDTDGLGARLTVLPGPVAIIVISPEDVTSVQELTQQQFTAAAYDEYGNLIPDAEFVWTAEGGIGSLNVSEGATVTLTAGETRTDGWLNVTSAGVLVTRDIAITAPVNAPQFDSPVPTQVRDEDSGSWTIDLGPLVSDDEHPDSELRWFASNETIVSASGENRTGQLVVTLATKPNMFGTNVLRLTVVDPDGVSGETNFTVVINPVNDRPTIDPIDPLVVRYDDPYTYNFMYYIEDVDNEYDELALTVDDESATYAHVDMLAITFTYPYELNGTTQKVTVTVDDGDLSSATTVSVTVSSDYVPEVFDPLPDVTMYQGEELLAVFDLDEHFTDPDAEMLFYVSGYEHVGVDITPDHEVDLQAPTDWSGEEYIVFSGIDPLGARVEDAIVVTVLPVNQPPWISGVPDLQVRYDLMYEFDLTRYMGDPDDDLDSLAVTTDDLHVAVMGTVLALLCPIEMNGTVHAVEITVSDGEFSDSWTINVTVSDNYPPEALTLDDHSFKEDLPMPYPVVGGLEDLFVDQEGGALAFEAYSWDEHMNVTIYDDAGDYRVGFEVSPDWFGETQLTIRATDEEGSMAESVIDVSVVSVGDAPVLQIDEDFTVTVGVQSALDISSCIYDPDSTLAQLRFEMIGDYAEFGDAMAGMLVIEFPEDFLDEGEYSRNVTMEVRVVDQDGLHDTDTITVTVIKPLVATPGQSPWLWLAMIAMGGLALGLFVVAVRMRKKPFVVMDVMLVHNDGFLIGRHAAPTKGEIDQDVLSGMLTAVLNFVEDSMAASEDALKSFGFGQYKVLVRRGERAFMAVVHEGDAPEGMDRDMGGFLEKVDKIYRKSLASWSGDIESEFAGVDLLLGSWVKEHSKGRNRKSRSVFGLRGARTTK